MLNGWMLDPFIVVKFYPPLTFAGSDKKGSDFPPIVDDVPLHFVARVERRPR